MSAERHAQFRAVAVHIADRAFDLGRVDVDQDRRTFQHALAMFAPLLRPNRLSHCEIPSRLGPYGGERDIFGLTPGVICPWIPNKSGSVGRCRFEKLQAVSTVRRYA